MRTINPTAFAELLQTGAPLHILDVRTAGEILKERLAVPVVRQETHIQPHIEQLKRAFPDQGEPLYVLCKAGVRADKAARNLERDESGFADIVVIRGGLDALKNIAGVEIRRGEEVAPVPAAPSPFGKGPA